MDGTQSRPGKGARYAQSAALEAARQLQLSRMWTQDSRNKTENFSKDQPQTHDYSQAASLLGKVPRCFAMTTLAVTLVSVYLSSQTC